MKSHKLSLNLSLCQIAPILGCVKEQLFRETKAAWSLADIVWLTVPIILTVWLTVPINDCSSHHPTPLGKADVSCSATPSGVSKSHSSNLWHTGSIREVILLPVHTSICVLSWAWIQIITRVDPFNWLNVPKCWHSIQQLSQWVHCS